MESRCSILVFVAKAGHTADIQQKADIQRDANVEQDSDVEQDAAPTAAAVPFDGDPADLGSLGSRLLFTANPVGLDGDVYDLQIEHMEFGNRTWTTVLAPMMRVRENVPATYAVGGAGASWEISLSLARRYDYDSVPLTGFQPTGLLDCEHSHANDVGVVRDKPSDHTVSEYFPVGPVGSNCCTKPCENGKSFACCNALCCSDGAGDCAGVWCCPPRP